MNFEIFFNEFRKHTTAILEDSSISQVEYNNTKKIIRSISFVRQILLECKNTNKRPFEVLKKQGKIRLKTSFYRNLSKVTNWFQSRDWNIFRLKSTRPKTIHYKYDHKFRKRVIEMYYDQKITLQTIYYHLAQEYDELAIGTIINIIKQDPRYKNKKIKKIKKHPIRYYDLPFGLIQMDLKIIGPKESPIGKRITIFDAKDEQSKLYYMEVIDTQQMHNLLQATKNMINYFEQTLGMPVKRIRTDNAMSFKENNFVKEFEYSSLLASLNIKQEFIPKKEPECNGVIERQHSTLDKEFLWRLEKNWDIEKVKQEAKNFMNQFNFERPHYYKFLEKCNEYKSYRSRLWIPYEFYNKHKQSV